MAERQKIVAGNWKMNKTFQEAQDLLFDIADQLDERGKGDVNVIVCPPALYAELATDLAAENDFAVGVQNINDHESGAYTGEISAPMLASMGVEYAIIGHSERREYYKEADEFLARKVRVALEHDIVPIFCCGEVLEQRDAGKQNEVVKEQLEKALFNLEKEDFGKLVIAYEPVWAIGTGRTATPEQAQEMHAYIRKLISEKYDEEVAESTSILYGGSCKPSNAKGLFSQKDIDGGLIGGASLKADDFVELIHSF
ncbi:MAG: triose-phosphate isomerase [Bacteroidales bacterium]|nr:triose-phosphate isomerase [Bacteroidales bacterium]